jgi:hypothetical protein
MEQLSKRQTHLRRAVPWIYGAVVVASLLTMSVYEGSTDSLFWLCIDGILVAAFLTVGQRVGLWGRVTRATASGLMRRPCPEPPCTEGTAT